MAVARSASAVVVTVLAVLGSGTAALGAASPVDGRGPSEPPGTATASGSLRVPVVTLAPGQLRRGADARIPFLQDGWVHVNGTRFRTRLPAGRHQVLLGRSGDTWLVANGRKRRLQVHHVRAGRAPVKVPRSRLTGGLVGVRVSRDGEHLVAARFERESSTFEVRRVADGTVVDRHVASTQVGQLPYDAADGHVLMQREAGDVPPRELYAADWEVGVGDRRLGSDLVAGFLRRDVVFVAHPEGTRRFGPTPVSAPGTPAWSARFAPLALSPDGELVLGTGPRLVRRRQVLQVRRMTDGRVVQKYSYGGLVRPEEFWAFNYQPTQTARFETNRRFVFELTVGGRTVLVRCTTADVCTRASRSGGDVSVPHERSRWIR